VVLLCARWLAVAPEWNEPKSVMTCNPVPLSAVVTVISVEA